MIKVVIDSLRHSLLNQEYFLAILKEEMSGRYIVMGLTSCDFAMLTYKLNAQSSPRPMTYDFFLNFIRQSNLSLRRVYIHSVVNGLFQAQVLGMRRELGLSRGFSVDCRASDALLTALHFDLPIYVSTALLQNAAINQLEQLSDAKIKIASLIVTPTTPETPLGS